MQRTTALILMGFFSWLFGSCKPESDSQSSNGADAAPSNEITAGMQEEGFVDLHFAIGSHERQTDGSQVFVATGTYKGQEAGFRFQLPAEWKEGSLGDTDLTTYQAIISVESLGKASNTFVGALHSLYELSNASVEMAEEIQFTGISLGGDPRTPESGPVKIKLFYEPAGDDPDYDDHYAEHYLNIYLEDGRIEFHEKDPEYRPAVARALTTSG